MITLVGSLYDHFRKTNKQINEGFLVAFSVQRNIRRLITCHESTKGSLEHDLQFLYATRFLTMFCVIGGHVLLLNEIFPISNPEYIEVKYHEMLTMLLTNGFKVIETYFIISGLLMSLNFMKFITNSPFGLKHFIHAIIYRYLRLIIVVY